MTYRDECAGCVQKSQEIDRLSVKSTPKWKLNGGDSFFAFISSVFAFVGAVAATVLFLGPPAPVSPLRVALASLFWLVVHYLSRLQRVP